MTPRDASRSSLSDHCSRNGAISLSRNASSSSLNATIFGRPGKVHEADISVRLPVPSSAVWTSRSRPSRTQLRDAVRGVPRAAEAPKAYVRRMAEHDDAGITPEVWTQIVDLGWTGLLVPEECGGLGLGVVDAVVVQEEMGRAVFPGPYFSSAILATLAARALGLDDRLAALAAGRERGTVALDEAGYGEPARTGARARRRPRQPLPARRREADGDGRRTRADWVLVPARTREGLRTFLVERPRRAARAESRHHPQVRAARVRRHARAAGRPGRRPDRALAARARRRGGAARGRADRCERSRERARARLRAGARSCSTSRCRSSR